MWKIEAQKSRSMENRNQASKQTSNLPKKDEEEEKRRTTRSSVIVKAFSNPREIIMNRKLHSEIDTMASLLRSFVGSIFFIVIEPLRVNMYRTH